MPLTTPAELAQVGQDLGISHAIGLTRIIWNLNTDEQRSLDKVTTSWSEFVGEAMNLLSQASAEEGGKEW